MPQPITIIGVDCACEAAKVGLALGTFGTPSTVEDVRLGSKGAPPAEVIAEWVRERGAPVLVALDAPLGWPALLGEALADHRAGAGLPADAHALFRRATDRFVRKHLGKQPLDVGADRIARTAHAALALLGDLREELAEPIPLAWSPTVETIAAIEVYPAATLKAHGINPRGYKHKNGASERQRLLNALGAHLHLPPDRSLTIRSPDAVDAAVCVLAAQDFLQGSAISPPEPESVELAEREGWIWVRSPGDDPAPG